MTENHATDTFDTTAFLAHLDELFDTKQATTKVEPYLMEALQEARQKRDRGAELTILNEIMGFYRSQSLHDKGVKFTREALALVESMGLENSAAATTTLINAATEYRAAGEYETALPLYRKALAQSVQTLAPTDRKIAALHNNLSIAYSDLNRYEEAQKELETALELLERTSPDPATDIDVGSTHANLALVCYRNGNESQANAHIEQAMRIFAAGHHEDASHFSSALAAAGETFFRMGHVQESISTYERALDLIERSYGTQNDYYSITSQNLEMVRDAAATQKQKSAEKHAASAQSEGSTADTAATDTIDTTGTTPASITGLALSRLYWEECGKPMIAEKYPHLQNRIAAGLVGHGSEAYGFDDDFSRDHDFAPRFCLWLTPDDYAQFGEQLQADYDTLPANFMGYSRTDIQRTPRSQGAQKRDGVFAIPNFYEAITGLPTAPASAGPLEIQWLTIDEATLAAATNGQIFADPLGEFSSIRQQFKAIPDDVRLSLISRRLGMLSQSGQYNFPRMIARGNGGGAWRALNEFVHTAASMVFLVNGPSAAGYLPYYKWEMAALKHLSTRMGTRLAQVADCLESIMANASAACYPATATAAVSHAPLGDYSAPHSAAADHVFHNISLVCEAVRDELIREGLTSSTEEFLEWQRPYVEEAIANPQLRSL